MWQDKQMCDRVEAVNENKRLELAAVSDSLVSFLGDLLEVLYLVYGQVVNEW